MLNEQDIQRLYTLSASVKKALVKGLSIQQISVDLGLPRITIWKSLDNLSKGELKLRERNLYGEEK